MRSRRSSSRRCLVAAALVLAAPFCVMTHPARAEAPMVQTQAPGWYRMMLGDFEITALNDGTVALHVEKLLTNTTQDRITRALRRAWLTTPVETSVNAYLVNTGSKLVLIDVGAGNLFGPTLGKLVDHLRAAGYQPEQVDEVYITHMHPDHVGGLMAGDRMAFPNAVVRADKDDAAYWLDQATADKAPADAQGFFKGAMASLNPYVAAGRFKPFDGNVELVPGVRALASHGHTRGHTTYVVESRGQKLVLWGDLMHVAAVQFAAPQTTIRFDTDPKAAMAERRRAYADAAKGGYWVAAAHLAFPGIGRLRSEGGAYVFVPANYTTMLK
jgi:glyoxylase-like metal-dependent hydrolase (beta-lactamase superfamily II)